MKYLFIGAHVDDVELSCGGMIAVLKQSGNYVHVVSLSGVYNGECLRNEWMESMKILGVDEYTIHDFTVRNFYTQRQQILDYLITFKNYDTIVTHSTYDQHQDHSVVAMESIRAFKNNNLLAYTGEWNGNPPLNYFFTLDQHHIEKKIEALKCYQSQKDKPYMAPSFVWANAMNNGVKCGEKFAEGFSVVRYVE